MRDQDTQTHEEQRKETFVDDSPSSESITRRKIIFFFHTLKVNIWRSVYSFFLVLFQLGENIHVVRIYNPGCLYLEVTILPLGMG